MQRLSPYHRERLERKPPETEPKRDHQRAARIEAETRAVTRPEHADRKLRADGGHPECDDRQRCLECGDRIASVTVRGPNEAILEPCGHIVPATTARDLIGKE